MGGLRLEQELIGNKIKFYLISIHLFLNLINFVVSILNIREILIYLWSTMWMCS